jgi:hypothetical protein
MAWDRFPPADDGVFYDALARRISEGDGYTWAWPDGSVTAVAHYPVGYPALLSSAYMALGPTPLAAIALHLVVGTVGAVAIHAVARVGTSARAARWAGLLVALHPALLAYSPAIMTEGVASALLAVPFALSVVARRLNACGGRWMTVLSGAFLGGAGLVRPEVLLLAPVVGWVSSVRPRPLSFGLVLVGALAALAPWTARNARAFGRPLVVSANGGWNLLIGTDARANGGWRPLDVPAECREVWEETAKDSCFARVAAREIASHPGSWLALVPRKLAATLDYGGEGASYLSRSRPDLVPRWLVLVEGAFETLLERGFALLLLIGLARETGSKARRSVALASAIALVTPYAWPAYVGVVVLFLAGGRARMDAEPVRLVACACLGVTALVHAVFFGASRYALLALPWVAAAALTTMMAERGRRVGVNI